MREKTITLYHLSPKENRASILLEGLRRCSQQLGRLVLHSARRAASTEWRNHIAQRHGVTPDNLDLWRFTAQTDHVYEWHSGIVCVTMDIRPARCELVTVRHVRQRGKR